MQLWSTAPWHWQAGIASAALASAAVGVTKDLLGDPWVSIKSSLGNMQAGIASAALASAAVGVTNVVGTVVAASLMDRAGRKQLLTLSFTGMGLSMLVMAAGLGLESLAGYAGPIALVRGFTVCRH